MIFHNKEDLRNAMIACAQNIIDSAEDIVNDVDRANVDEIYITIRLQGDAVPQMDITKYYKPGK